MRLTPRELEKCSDLEKLIIAGIERTNWTDTPLTAEETHVIGMAVTATYYRLKEEGLLPELS